MRSYSVRNILLTVVWGTHLSFLCSLFLQPHFSPKIKEHKSLIVNTVVPPPRLTSITKPIKTSAEQPHDKKRPLQKKEPEPSPPPQKTPAAHPSSTIASSQKKQPAILDKKRSSRPPSSSSKVEPRANISDSLLKELEESISKLETSPTKKASIPRSPPPRTWKLQIDSSSSDSSDADTYSYEDLLVSHLQHTLTLPDYGEVKIQLSLRQDGSVIKIAVLKTQSKENRRYLEERLPLLTFPRFEGSLALQKESSFTLTFVNEM